MKAAIFSLALLAFANFSHAHEGGHGPVIPGVGSNGGEMTAVVAATDIDQNENAPIQGVAEWKIENGKLTVWLWNADLKASAQVAGGEIKWIVLFPEGTPPLVLKVPLTLPTTTLEFAVPPHAKTIEAVLTDFNGNNVKHVFAFGIESSLDECSFSVFESEKCERICIRSPG